MTIKSITLKTQLSRSPDRAQQAKLLAKPNGINRWSKRGFATVATNDESISRDFRIPLVRPVYLLATFPILTAASYTSCQNCPRRKMNCRNIKNAWCSTPEILESVLRLIPDLRRIPLEDFRAYWCRGHLLSVMARMEFVEAH